MAETVLITGASSGFGEACARKFAAEGRNLILAARREDRLEQLSRGIAGGVEVETVALDVRVQSDVQQLADSLAAKGTTVDVLVNNAGLALGMEPADAVELNDWEVMVDTNIKGLMYCTRAILPLMVEAGGGHVINMGSVAASWPYPGGNAYGGSKAFVQQFSRNLRTDLLGRNIRVTLVEPGMAETEFSIIRFGGDEGQARQVYEGMKPLTAEDVAEVVYFVASLPQHVNVNAVEIMPTQQTWGPFAVDRQ